MVFHHVLRMEKYIACLGHFQIRKKINKTMLRILPKGWGGAAFTRNVIGTLCSGHRIDLDADKPLDADLNHLILTESKSCTFQTHQGNSGKIGKDVKNINGLQNFTSIEINDFTFRLVFVWFDTLNRS